MKLNLTRKAPLQLKLKGNCETKEFNVVKS